MEISEKLQGILATLPGKPGCYLMRNAAGTIIYVGKAVNPLGLQGQVEGGVVMGIGNALTEHFIVEEGRVFTDWLARYRMPSIMHTPEITSIVVEHPTADGPYGAKGVGEIVSIPTTPAITNAIYNAIGVRLDHLPVDQAEIVKLIKEQSRQPAGRR